MAESAGTKPTQQQNDAADHAPTCAASHSSAPPITISNCTHHCNHPDCCKPVKKPVAKKFVSKKAAAVLTSAEIDRMIDLGLGRGIDSTDAKPWFNKSAFQVRRVTAESVIGTEEGGSLQSYEREVTSVLSHQTDLKASVVVPKSPVQIGIDAEQSRSVSTTRRAVGKKVINRTVSFLSDFNDVVYDHSSAQANVRSVRDYRKVTAESDKVVSSDNTDGVDDSVADVQNEYYTFEQRLSRWIVRRMLQRQELNAQELRAAGKPVGEPKFVIDKSTPADPLYQISDFLYKANEEEKRKIIHDCYAFVTHFRITHYVSSIELGATEYRVFSETDFNSKIGAGGSLAVEKLANLSVSHTRTSRKLRRASDVKTIGKISTTGTVGRGTHDEAVVGIRVEPIPNLVKMPYLKLSLQRSLVHYMEEQGDTSSGPFIIAFGTEKLLRYWSVSEDYAVHATSNPQNASLFFIISDDNGKHPYEFHIAYMGDNRQALRKRVSSLTPLTQKPIEAIPRYLNANVSAIGTNRGPLHLKYHVSSRSRLLLFGRVSKDEGPISTQTWTQGRDVFFINCARRRMKRDGYIAMRRRHWNREEQWITSCLPTRSHHNDSSIFMLFRLLPASYRDQPSLLAEPNKAAEATAYDDLDSIPTLDEQLQRYERGTAPDAFRVPPSPRPGRKTKHTPEDSERLYGESTSSNNSVESHRQPRIRFDTSGGNEIAVPESKFLLSALTNDPTQSTITAEDAL